MAQEKRKHLRTKVTLSLRVTFSDGSILETETWDISDGGIGINLPEDSLKRWEVGTFVKTKVIGLPFDSPELTMEVVRIVQDRVGLRLVA